jgi:hypothetical protein
MIPRPFPRDIVIRTGVVWATLHLAMGLISTLAGVPFPRSFVGSTATSIWLAAAAAGVVWLDLWRKRELVFLANLGIGFRGVGAFVAAACILLDVALRLLVV